LTDFGEIRHTVTQRDTIQHLGVPLKSAYGQPCFFVMAAKATNRAGRTNFSGLRQFSELYIYIYIMEQSRDGQRPASVVKPVGSLYLATTGSYAEYVIQSHALFPYDSY